MIYLDNAATSLLKPPEVAKAMTTAMRTMASPGRGGHEPAAKAADTAFRCREELSEFFRAPGPEHVAFTMNATHAVNIAIATLVKPGDRVVISGYEHNAVTRPLHMLGAETDAAVSPLFEPEAAIEAFRKRLPGAKCCVCTHVSNVFGFILPVEEIAAMCREYGVSFVLDASQSAGVLNVDMEALGAEFVAMPGHKGLLGPQGIGALLLRPDFAETLEPVICGGTGSASDSEDVPAYFPDRLEPGTPNLPGVFGWEAALAYLQKTTVHAVQAHDRMLCQRFLDGLRDIPGVNLIGPDTAENRVGVFSLDFPGKDNAEVSAMLEERFGILTRCGLHCAPSAHRTLGTFPRGTVRLSFGWYTTEQEVDRALEAVAAVSAK